ncbi:MAG: response regulator transcription factor [Austwickia sp.]|nr:response regulator transcription factor [Austwickia sp.]
MNQPEPVDPVDEIIHGVQPTSEAVSPGLPGAEPAEAAATPVIADPGRILVADATDQRRALAVLHLSQAGYTVETVADPADAWRSLRQGPAQLAILEVKPPALTGLEVLRRIRSMTWGAELPVILMVSGLREEDVDAGIALGANEFLVKPFSQRELVLRVESVLHHGIIAPAQEPGYTPRHSSAPTLSGR